VTAKPKQSRRTVSDKRLPKASLLERMDRPTSPDLRPELDGYASRLKVAEALQDKHEKDIAWLRTGVEAAAQVAAQPIEKPSLWPLWTMLIVEMAGLGALFAKVYGYAPY
jgi:hypothetical protein